MTYNFTGEHKIKLLIYDILTSWVTLFIYNFFMELISFKISLSNNKYESKKFLAKERVGFLRDFYKEKKK